MKNTIFLCFTAAAMLAGCGGVAVRGGPFDDVPEADAAAADAGADAGGAQDASSVDVPAVPDVPSRDGGPTDAGQTCTGPGQCPRGTECFGGEGCGIPWTCVPQLGRACTADYAPFCGCDGRTFYGSSSCPERPWARRGTCETPPADAGRADAGPPGDCVLSNGTRCAVGTSCPIDECNVCFCMSPGHLLCTGLACVDGGWTPPDAGVVDAAPAADGGPGTCSIEGVICREGVPCRVGPCTTCTCFGDTVGCSVEPGCGADGGSAPDAVVPPPLCPAQDARGVGLCELFLGWMWNGAECASIGGCSCAGADCRSLYRTQSACDADHAMCPRPL